jgi:hypothetical protein
MGKIPPVSSEAVILFIVQDLHILMSDLPALQTTPVFTAT